MSLSPATLRAMRAAVDWSMRDLATASSVALATVLKAESGEPVSDRIERRLRAALRAKGVTCAERDGVSTVRIAESPPADPGRRVALGLGSLPFVTVRGPRADGTFRVFFEVPANRRPKGWWPTHPLPHLNRRGDLTDPEEVARIRRDAKQLQTELAAARAREGRFPARGGQVEP